MNPSRSLFAAAAASLSKLARHALLPVALTLGGVSAQAEPQSLFVPFEGAGNLSAFTATSGGWVGSIGQVAPPVVAQPLQLVSVVLFELDALTQTLSGSFEFTTTDLMSTLFGTVAGSYGDVDILNSGGQFSLDYTVLGGTGAFLDASGYGLAFLNYDPAGSFDNYAEIGLLDLTVPEPGSLALAAAGLAVIAVRRRKARPVN
jgi:PEP-CTERM motif